jgi:hypothetical protein
MGQRDGGEELSMLPSFDNAFLSVAEIVGKAQITDML